MGVSASVWNEMFIQKVSSSADREKFAQYGGSFVRDRLREMSFARKLVPPEPVTRADCQVSVNHDTLVKIVEVEPQSRALSVTFRGQPTARFIRAPRAEAAFYTISSELYQKTQQELLAYQMPITKILEDNVSKDIQEVEDRDWLLHVEACVQTLQTEANGGAPRALHVGTIGATVEFSVRKGELARHATGNSAEVLPVQRPDLVNLFKLLDTNRLRAHVLLMTEPDWDDLLQWTVEDLGDRVQSETAVEGYKYNTILGRSYVRTIKTDILRPGNIYAFPKPEFFAKYYVLNNTQFYIDKIANLIQFQAWEDIAMLIANVAGPRKLELYPGDANPETNADTLLHNFIPVEEDALGAPNNRVDEGLVSPQVRSF